jgi:cysteine-rich repeat protein
VGRKFNWALSACVTLGLVACGGGKPAGTTVITPPDGTGGSSAGDGGGGDGGDDQPIFGSSGDTGFPDPEAGSGGCSGSCGGTDDPGGPGTLCGNRQLDDGEQCDDGNSVPGDGCTGACNLEPNFACDTVGEACISTIACGDGVVAGLEAWLLRELHRGSRLRLLAR